MRKLGIILLILVLVVLGGAYFSAGFVAKIAIQKMAARALEADVEIFAVTVSPFEGNIAINGFRIHNPDGFEGEYALEIGNISVQTRSKGPMAVLQNPLEIASILVEDMSLNFELGMNGNNIYTLQGNARRYSRSIAESSIAPENQKKVIIDVLEINNPKLFIKAKGAGKDTKGFETPLSNIVVRDIGREDKPANIAYMFAYVFEAILIKLPLVDNSIQDTMGNMKDVLDGAAGTIKGVLSE